MVARGLAIGILLSGSAGVAQQPHKKNWPPFTPIHQENARSFAPTQTATTHMIAATPGSPMGARVAFEGMPAEGQHVATVVLRPTSEPTDIRLVSNSPVQQATIQGGRTDPDSELYTIQLEVPTLERVTRRESERNLQERIRQEARNRPDIGRIEFPEEPPVSTDAYTPRQFPPMTVEVEPNYLCYGRLYFEERNSERYGWDMGLISPLFSSGVFLWDTITLPYQLGTDPCRKFDCNTGYCLPGDPVPFYLYPPQISLTGLIFQAGAVVAVAGAFPG